MGMISENVRRILAQLPPGVTLVAAAKTRSAAEIEEAVEAGVGVIGENYLQDAQAVHPVVKLPARWHFIGHLQRRKVRKAIEIFDMIETLDSPELADEIEKRCAQASKTMEVLIEVNSGREDQKAGVLPEDVPALVREAALRPHLRVRGLMTMGPRTGDPEAARPYFRRTRSIFEELRGEELPDARMEVLSMGMSNSYRIAIEEGANLVRIGTAIFGPRACSRTVTP